MKKYLLSVVFLACVSGQIFSQAEAELDPYEQNYESGEQKIRGGWGFNVQISSEGFILGGLYNYKIAKYTFLLLLSTCFGCGARTNNRPLTLLRDFLLR